ncbi:MAG: phosphate ABC transporter substrate-binding protein [Gammaproteobacteria bacterium]|nr:phosphate ABC transporter substrate-binding protein [Gammaproteobacteria bacterium]
MGFLKQVGLCVVMIIALLGNAYAEPVLRYAGATTLQRFFMPEVARLFTDATAIKVQIEGGNTNPGISALLQGDIDIAGAGRSLTDAEKEKGLVEHFLGWDTLAIVVHEQNPVESLTLEQLQKIFSGEITDWQEVGGQSGPIVLISCPEGSGMRSAAQKLILKDKKFSSREIIAAIVSEADQQVSQFPVGIAALSHSMLDAPKVKTVLVNGADPTAENIKNGSYPLAKPLALVTKGQPEGDVARFLDLVNSSQGRAALQKKFVPAE